MPSTSGDSFRRQFSPRYGSAERAEHGQKRASDWSEQFHEALTGTEPTKVKRKKTMVLNEPATLLLGARGCPFCLRLWSDAGKFCSETGTNHAELRQASGLRD